MKKQPAWPIAEEPLVFGRVIAEREYRVGREKILLQIGTPHRASWKRDFYCPVRLVRGGKTTLKRAFGVDFVQRFERTIAKAVLERGLKRERLHKAKAAAARRRARA